jgi:nitrile hydratase
MNGVHDMGGMHGFGPLDIIPDEPVFRAEWERRMFAMFILLKDTGHFNGDQWRSAIEQMDPAKYLLTDYYEHWLHSLETWMQADGSLNEDEIQVRIAELSREVK